MGSIVEESKKFLVSYLKNRPVNYKVKYPWRSDWQFIIMHSLRVYSYVEKIIAANENSISEEEIIMVKTAAILHDIGKIHCKAKHALVGSIIVDKWLIENSRLSREITEKDRLLKIIRNHSDKGSIDKDNISVILKDADLLDEIGVLSIFMAANHLDENSPYFFHQLLERTSGKEIKYCDKQMEKLYTGAAKEILKEKIDFIEEFNNQLSSELEGTEEMYSLYKIKDVNEKCK